MNGDGTYSRDFTYIDNVIQANVKAMLATDAAAENTVFNVAYGDRTNLNLLVDLLRESLSKYDPAIAVVKSTYGEQRIGDIPHSLASIDKARMLLDYYPDYDIKAGIDEAVKWYWENL